MPRPPPRRPNLAFEARGGVELGEALAGVDREASSPRRRRPGGDLPGRLPDRRGRGRQPPSRRGQVPDPLRPAPGPVREVDAPVLGRLAPGEAETDILRGDDARGLALGERETRRARLRDGRALTYTWRTAPGKEHVREAIYQTTEKFRLDLPNYRNGQLRVSHRSTLSALATGTTSSSASATPTSSSSWTACSWTRSGPTVPPRAARPVVARGGEA